MTLGRSSIRRQLLQFWDSVRLLSIGGTPTQAYRFPDGIGDDLMGTVILREWRSRGEQRLWVVTKYPELYKHNSDCAYVVGPSPNSQRMLNHLSCPVTYLSYARYNPEQDRDDPPAEHIIKILARKAGLSGQIALRPYFHLTHLEHRRGRLAPKQIAIQTSGAGSRAHMLNKEWFPNRFQQVVNALGPAFTFVQLGDRRDPLLDGVRDLRGRTTLRESAAVLANSLAFCGIVGGLMHLARAVDCRAAIVYGGRELPSQSGYAVNENLAVNPPCSPCWFRNRCDYRHVCVDSIHADEVAAALRRQIARAGSPLPIESVSLDEPSPPVAAQ